LKTLEERELIPFKYLVQENIPAVMSGHLSFPHILPGNRPASLSSFFLTDLLRNKMGFKGLIINIFSKIAKTAKIIATALFNCSCVGFPIIELINI